MITTRRMLAQRRGVLGPAIVFLLAASPITAKSTEIKPAPKQVTQILRKLPLRFEPNWGQASPEVKFIGRGSRYSVSLLASGALFRLNARRRSATVRMRLLGANLSAEIEAFDQVDATSSYFFGHNPRAWISGIPNYGRVSYRNLYPGIDAVFYGVEGQLEYDLVLTRGANPAAVRIAFDGAKRLRVDQSGNLILTTEVGEVCQEAPLLYQFTDAGRRRVPGHYVIVGNEVHFEVKAYDRSRPLVIDPRLTYSTLLGGNSFDEGVTVAVDSQGNAYVTGWTDSTTFPVTSGASQARYGGGPGLGDAFVAKISPAGKLIYATYLGGSGEDAGWGVAVDSSGSAYVSGHTSSADFPTTRGAYQTKLAGRQNCFVSKLTPSGAGLAYSTYLGGAARDRCLTLAVDAMGSAYVSGTASSNDFPITPGAFQPKLGGGYDAFATKLSPAGNTLVYSTFLGGVADDVANSITTDSMGNAYIAGFTLSAGFPVTAGSLQTRFGGGSLDSFVTKLNPAGTGIAYSTFIGGRGDEYARAIAVDANGNAYVAGRTSSANFPTTPGAFQTILKGQINEYCLKLDPAGAALIYSTLFGGTNWDQAEGLAVDSGGTAWIAGITQSADFPVTADALQATLRGNQAGTITHLNATGTSLIYSSYVGGAGQDAATWVTLDAAGNAYVTGEASSRDFPTTPGASQTQFGGGVGNAFLMRLDACAVSVSPTAQAFSGSSRNGVINVVAGVGCTWGATTSANWISIVGANTAAGNGTVNFMIAANAGPARTGIIYVADQAFTVSQEGSPACNYAIDPRADTFDLTGGFGTIAVSAAAGCTWTAVSSVPWITISTGTSGAGQGTVSYTVAAGQAARTGVVIIAGIPLPVSQTVTGPVCSYSVSSWGASFSAAGGTAGENVAAASECQWAATTTASWITIPESRPATGSDTVNFVVAANPGSASRSAVLSVAGQDINIRQDGVCTYALSVGGMSFDLTGGTGTVSVTTGAGCHWTVDSPTDWITLSSGQNITGSGAVTFSVSSNSDPRVGSLTIAGVSFTVSQLDLAPGCTYQVTPSRHTFAAAGSTTIIKISAPDGCPWTATGVDWLTIGGPATGSGGGAVAFTVASNSGPARTGSLVIAGQVVTVAQSSACDYSLGAAGQTFNLGGGPGWLTVNASPGCSWTATSNSDWINISFTSSGTGSGVLAYSAAAGAAARSGSLTVAGQTFTIEEAGAAATCFYSASPAKKSFSTAGGTGTISVTAPQSCAWQAAASDFWIVLSTKRAAGNGTLSFSVAPNTSGTTRSGTITAAGVNIVITQPGPCNYSVSPAGQNFDFSGGSWVASVTTDSACPWTAVSNAGWITVTSGSSASGNGAVTYSIDPSSVARTGTLTIAGTEFRVNQVDGRGFLPIRIHAGGSDYVDPLNQRWSADTAFSGGDTYTAASPVSGTTTPDLYQSGRTGDGGFQYQFPVPNGMYTLKLKFSEPVFMDPGERTFHVVVNSETVLPNFDIVARAGEPQNALDAQIPVRAADGKILIRFLPVVNSPIVSAIEIVPQTGLTIALSPTGAVLAPGQRQPLTAVFTGTDNTKVTWSMYPQIGTLSADGIYTAPTSVSKMQIVAITATSTADTSQNATVSVALIPGG